MMGRPHTQRAPAKRPHRDQRKVQVPVVLPRVVIDITADGTMTVTVDGHPHKPAPFAPPWAREEFGHILNQLTEQHHSPVRVQVREADGTTFTDIITPGKPRRPEPGPEVEAPARMLPELVALRGESSVAGEALAVTVTHSGTVHDGIVRSVLTPAQAAPSPTRKRILPGRVSGEVTVRHPA